MNLVQTKDYLLYINVQRTPFNIGDIGVKWLASSIEHKTLAIANEGNKHSIEEHWRKVIAYYPLNKDVAELNLPLLPKPFMVDIDNLALEKYPIVKKGNGQYTSTSDYDYGYDMNSEYRTGFIEGYKTAEPNQFNLDEVRKHMYWAVRMCQGMNDSGKCPDEIIDMLEKQVEIIKTEKMPKEFIIKMTIIDEKEAFEPNFKIIDGKLKQELVGTFKY